MTKYGPIILLKKVSKNMTNAYSKLKEITILENVTTIGPGAFSGTPLESVEFENNSKLEVIGAATFSNTRILENLSFLQKLK